jgi:hypothetical protein
VLSLLYGWFDLSSSSGALLRTRLEAIAVGAVIGIAASWLILPVRTRDVLRRRSAAALGVLGEIVGADWADTGKLRRLRVAFDQRVELVNQIARPLRARRLLVSRWRHGAPEPADAIDALQRCAEPIRVVVRAVGDDGDAGNDPRVASLTGEVAANVAAVSRAIGRRSGEPFRPAAEHKATGESPYDTSSDQIGLALAVIDGALGELWGVFYSSGRMPGGFSPTALLRKSRTP